MIRSLPFLYFVERLSGRSKMSVTCFFTSANFSSRARSKPAGTHYDTLEISPNATQNEIKAAYYKLTMQYHPDKNKSRTAKEKFQDISNAYSVLGNHNSRKDYDRKLLIKYGKTSSVYSDEQSSDYMVRHQRGPGRSSTTVIFNIDKWTQAHYGDVFDRTLKMKQAYKRYKGPEVMEEKPAKEKMNIVQSLIDSVQALAVCLIVCSISYAYVYITRTPKSDYRKW